MPFVQDSRKDAKTGKPRRAANYGMRIRLPGEAKARYIGLGTKDKRVAESRMQRRRREEEEEREGLIPPKLMREAAELRLALVETLDRKAEMFQRDFWQTACLMHPCQRERTSITALRLELQKIISEKCPSYPSFSSSFMYSV